MEQPYTDKRIYRFVHSKLAPTAAHSPVINDHMSHSVAHTIATAIACSMIKLKVENLAVVEAIVVQHLKPQISLKLLEFKPKQQVINAGYWLGVY